MVNDKLKKESNQDFNYYSDIAVHICTYMRLCNIVKNNSHTNTWLEKIINSVFNVYFGFLFNAITNICCTWYSYNINLI